jgi:hypothetical protein
MVIAPRARETSVLISLQFDCSRTVDSAAQDVTGGDQCTSRAAEPPAQWKRRKRVAEIVLLSPFPEDRCEGLLATPRSFASKLSGIAAAPGA